VSNIVDVDDCDVQPCLNGATCFDEVDNFMCQCTPGYNGTVCDIGIIVTESILNFKFLIEKYIQMTTVCEAVFLSKLWFFNIQPISLGDLMQFIDIFWPIDIDDCIRSPCQHGASCIDAVDSFSCICPGGLTGLLCDTGGQEMR